MQRRGLPLAYLITVGNKAGDSMESIVQALLADPRVSAIGLHIEGLDNVAAFSAVALQALAQGVPLVALKAGTSALGAQTAMSHTSSLAGPDALYDALFARCGVARAVRGGAACGREHRCGVQRRRAHAVRDLRQHGRARHGLKPGPVAKLGRGVRVDTHVYSGYEVPPNYDSMIAKLIVTGATREIAIARMLRSLREFVIGGIKTTIPFQVSILENSAFRNGTYNIGWVETFLATHPSPPDLPYFMREE
jgi:hypothetical protein